MHENFDRDAPVELGSNRTLGLLFGAFFFIVGGWPLVAGRAPRLWALGLAAAFLVAAIVRPGVLSPLNRWWSRLGLLLHRVVNPVILGVLFVFVLAPTGLLMRALGKDPLRLRLDRAASSYWIERHPPGPAPDTMRNQF